MSGDSGTSDCEGEDQEDSSSVHHQIEGVLSGFQNLGFKEEPQDKPDDALSAFREQWQRELLSTPSPQKELPQKDAEPVPDNDEEKAKQWFLHGVELERCGKLYEAVQQYKRAVQLLPDVEQLLYASEPRPPTPEEPPEIQPETVDEGTTSDEEEKGDLITRFQRILSRKGAMCEPEIPTKSAHISWLPYELVLYVLRWVVSADLDVVGLERCGLVCRGLYVATRDTDLWRSVCVRTWGIDCGTPKQHGFTSWRDMYIDRPRLNLNGCYISKTTYLRHGENAYQDQSYKPWYLIEYYRYLRFFPEGLVLMSTTADEPASCVGQLTRNVRPGVMVGHYRLVQDKVIIVLKKSSSEKKVLQTSNTRFRSRRKETTAENQEQKFHLELQLRSVRSRRNWQLTWRAYAVCRRDTWSTFELQHNKYPPFWFSVVRSYTAEGSQPLA